METQSTDFDNFIVLDFEATCDQGGNFKPQEIIEFPSVLLDGRTLQSISEFQYFVKPTVNPQLTPFCTELTGITQVGKPDDFCLIRKGTSRWRSCAKGSIEEIRRMVDIARINRS